MFYPQVYLNDCLYQILKLISCKRIEGMILARDERIDLSKGENSGNLYSLKCMICNDYYFEDIGFKYQPCVCN